MGKNDLSALKLKTEKKLPAVNTPSLLSKNKVGRPIKPAEECESELISLKLTPLEMEVLKKKAGLVPLSRYLKHHLRTETDIFSA
jgi:hypothetical protein